MELHRSRPAILPIVAAAAVVVVVLFGLAAHASADTQPAAHWAFDEPEGAVVVDGVGDLDGAIAGAARIDDGVVGRALRFEGDARVTIPDDPVLRTGDLSVVLWVRGDPAAPPADGQVILEKGDADCAGGAYALVVDGGHVAVRWREAVSPGGVQTLTVDTAEGLPSLWDGEWHQVALTSRAGDWGFIALYQQGWTIGSNLLAHEIAQDGLDETALAVGGPGGTGCGSDGFEGDLDELRVYPRVLGRDELAANEPVVPTTVDIESVAQLGVDQSSAVQVRLQPAPLAPGRINAYLLAEDGVERLVGAANLEWPWALPADGRFTVNVHPEDGGSATLRVRFDAGLPQASSETTTPVTVAKAWSGTHIGLQNTYIAGEPIDVGVGVSTAAHVKVNGTVELYERTPGGPVLLGSKAVVSPVGSFDAGAEFTLPARPAGDLELEARYLGGTAHLPSLSLPATITIQPGLVVGTVTINGGAATTNDPVVQLSMPADGAVAIQVARSLDDIRLQDPPEAWVATKTTWLTSPFYGDDQDGVRTLWVRFADALGRWSGWSSDTIVLDRGLESGTVAINGGATRTNDHSVTVAVPVEDAAAVGSVQLSNDGRTWSEPVPYAASVAWKLADGDGQRTVHVRWLDDEGRQSVGASDSILVDTQPPVISGVRASVGGGRPSDRMKVRMTWTGSDPGSGVAGYDVALSRDGGAWSTIARGIRTTSFTTRLAPGHRYAFQVRGTDKLGHRSGWMAGSSFRLVTYQEGSARISYAGRWTRAVSSSFWHGATRYSTRSTASATLAFNGNSVAWVAPVGPTRGSARVYVDGVLVATVSLRASSSRPARVVFTRSWSAPAAHTLTIHVVGTTGHPRVDVDGFVVLAPG